MVLAFFLFLFGQTTDTTNSLLDIEPLFFLENSQEDGLYGIRSESITETALQCAHKCTLTDNCEGFLWNSKNGSCSIGTTRAVSNGHYILTEAQTLLYTKRHICCFDLGYKLISNGVGVKCLYVSADTVSYWGARTRSACSELGGRLVIPNTVAWMEEVAQTVLNSGSFSGKQVFVGIDDNITENVFVWSDGKNNDFRRTIIAFQESTATRQLR